MLGDKAVDLIKTISRCPDMLLPFNAETISLILKEVNFLVENNQDDMRLITGNLTGTENYMSTVKCRHSIIQRNIQCVIAYHYHRLQLLRKMRSDIGGVLPGFIKQNLSSLESEWFAKYSNMLVQYMGTLDDGAGVDLSLNLKPPKAVYIEVKCLEDYGKFELNNGDILFLKKNSRHYLPRSECEPLIRQGIFEHILTK